MKGTALACLLTLGLAACQEEALDPAAVARGKNLSTTCTACHRLDSAVNMVGPGLKGVVGRKAGAVSGYEYSAGLKASGLKWEREVLIAFLQDPYALLPDTKMAVGALSVREAGDVVTYLQSLN